MSTKNKSNKNALKALIEAQAKKPVELTYGEGDDALVVTVSPVISFTKRTEMVKFIVDSAFTSGVDTIQSYTPQYVKLAKRCAVIDYYTNLKMPSKLNDLWMILNHTTVYHDVVEVVGEDIFDIFKEADSAIAAKKDYLAHKTDINGLFEKIGNTIGAIGSDFSKEDLTSMLEVFKNMPSVSEEQMIGGILKAQKDNSENN